MNREEILNRVKIVKPNEEYEAQRIFRSLPWGIAGMGVLYLILMLLNVFLLGKKDVNDLTCLLSGFSAITAILCFIQTKKKRFLFIGIPALVLATITFLLFLMQR